MQSFLQYRRFRTRLQAEIERHGVEKVTKCATPVDAANVQHEWQREQLPAASPSTVNDYGQEEAQIGGSIKSNAEDVPTRTDQTSNVPTRTRDSAPATISTELEDNDSEKQHEATDFANDSNVSLSTAHTQRGYETEADTEHPTPAQRFGTRLGRLMTGITVQKPDSKDEKPDVSGRIFLVDYQGPDDPMNPHNWTRLRRSIYTVVIVSIGFIVGLASSIDSAAIPQAAQEFGVSEVVESLATGLFLVGFGCGAFVAAPVSETIGRNPVYLVTGFFYMIFVMASALAPNIGAQLVFRFLAGFFGSTPLTCAGGSLSDMWNPVERTIMFPLFAFLSFLGPAAIGPAIGGFIGESSLVSWRWCDWVTLIWSGLIFTTVFLVLPETYTPVLLKWKAQHLRELTGDNRYKSQVEVRSGTFRQRMLTALSRPWFMLFLEPTVQLFTLYMSVVYIILFTFLTGFPFIFQDTYQLSQGITFLIFLALGVGFTFTYAFTPYLGSRYRQKQEQAQSEGRSQLAPEQRLFIAMISAPFLPIGLFWMAWTSYPSISVWSAIVSCVPIGFGTLGIFISTYQYIIDCYEAFSASGLVGLTFVRYIIAGGMIPVSIPFYENLGIHWTLTILGALSALMVPVPYVFFKYGPAIRKRSRRAVQHQ